MSLNPTDDERFGRVRFTFFGRGFDFGGVVWKDRSGCEGCLLFVPGRRRREMHGVAVDHTPGRVGPP